MKLRTRPIFAWLAFAVAGLSSAEAQQLKKIPRIGILVTSSSSQNSQRIEAFQRGLRELGYLEGKHILVEYRYGEGKPERLPTLAGQLVAMRVDVIVTGGSSPTQAAKDATTNPKPTIKK